ncbi:DNA topoisomerase VI subunit B [Candidatus Woesearchaeota archaeon]|nr:DNA topoisomerase VI subunit B [Candidatus Woesearchaeota archaeon]
MAETKADEMAKKQREISVAEFFEKNRHLLGFDNKRKALLTAVKEAVDNSLDACEEADILPDINVELIDMGNDRFRVVVEDNGPGIIENQIPKVFAKLLYGSKFHRLKQSRGQQGIGISASVMYAQLTTGRPAKILSKIGANKPAHYYELKIDTTNNKPLTLKNEEQQWEKPQGTKVELDLEGSFLKGPQSVDEYLRQTAIINPHVNITYVNPKAEQIIFPRATDKMPKQPHEIKPHPYGVELGMLLKMMANTDNRTMQAFLTSEFSRVGPGTAKEICEKAFVPPNTNPKKITRDEAEKLIGAIKETRIISPPTDCISPLGEEAFEKGLRKEVNAEYYCAVTRSPAVYRGNPFQVEVAIAYGGTQQADGSINLLRFANRVPLLYQQGACSIFKSTAQTNWKPYGLQQSNGSLPNGPVTIAVHIASVWVPFTSESKEAIAHYPEIISEVKLALQEAGRRLQTYVHKKHRVKRQLERANLFEKYIPEVADSLSRLTGEDKNKLVKKLQDMTKKDDIQKEIFEMESLKGEVDDEYNNGNGNGENGDSSNNGNGSNGTNGYEEEKDSPEPNRKKGKEEPKKKAKVKGKAK